MIARKLDSQERDVFYCGDLWDWEYSHDILISLWFEEVKEEQEQDRIDNLYKELSSDADIWHIEGNLFPRMTNAFFRQAIEKHMPKRLCRIIKRGDLQGKDFDYIIVDENVTEEQIKELQAGDWKEKEESERDRIDDLIDDIVNVWDVQIRQVIEDNMPKQKKFTQQEITEWCRETYHDYTGERIIKFIEDHWLLKK